MEVLLAPLYGQTNEVSVPHLDKNIHQRLPTDMVRSIGHGCFGESGMIEAPGRTQGTLDRSCEVRISDLANCKEIAVRAFDTKKNTQPEQCVICPHSN